MAYEIYYKESAIEDLQKIDKTQASRILFTILTRLTKNPQQYETLKYKFKGYRKLRVGDYRVIFIIEEKRVVIAHVGHRREVYE